jgi:hypothetical protein
MTDINRRAAEMNAQKLWRLRMKHGMLTFSIFSPEPLGTNDMLLVTVNCKMYNLKG